MPTASQMKNELPLARPMIPVASPKADGDDHVLDAAHRAEGTAYPVPGVVRLALRPRPEALLKSPARRAEAARGLETGGQGGPSGMAAVAELEQEAQEAQAQEAEEEAPGDQPPPVAAAAAAGRPADRTAAITRLGRHRPATASSARSTTCQDHATPQDPATIPPAPAARAPEPRRAGRRPQPWASTRARSAGSRRSACSTAPGSARGRARRSSCRADGPPGRGLLASPGPSGSAVAAPAPRPSTTTATRSPRPTPYGHDHLWWLDRMVRADHPLVERMTLVFHDWFATSNAGVDQPPADDRPVATCSGTACFGSFLRPDDQRHQGPGDARSG